jgi:hypothetical protein
VKRTASAAAAAFVFVLFAWLVPAGTAADGAPRPLAGSWLVTSYRPTTTSFDVPLYPGTACVLPPSLPAGQVVGGLASDDHAATVTMTCPGGREAHLVVTGIGPTGDYKGTINLTPGTVATAIELTVRRTDLVIFPIIALLVGIGLAIAAGRVTGRLNPLSVAEQESWQLEAQLPSVAESFARASASRPWADLSLTDSAQTTLMTARTQLSILRRGFSGLDKTDPTLLAVGAELRTVGDALAAWSPLAAQMAELQQANDELVSFAPAFHPPGAPTSPALVGVTAGLLAGGPVTVESVPRRSNDIQATSRAERDMVRAARTFVGLRTRADSILGAIGNDPMQSDRHNYAMWALRGIETDLRAMWNAQTAEAYFALDLQKDIVTIEGALDSLAPVQQPAFVGYADAPVPAAPSSAPAPPVQPVRAARRVGRNRLVDNVAVLIVTAVVTVWTGLAALYFGQPWGSVVDYGGALVWGFGVHAALQALSAGLDVLVLRPQPPELAPTQK